MFRVQSKDLGVSVANRDLSSTQFRQVTKQVVENPNELIQTGAAIAETILRQRQEAKVTQGVSQAQLELGKLDNQYRIDFEHDPMGGLEAYKADRDKIYSEIGKGISPLYGRDWLAKTTAISTRNDATMQAWALKQSRINTIDSVNDTMKNNFKQASNDGQTFGLSDESEIEAFVNFGTSMEALDEYAAKNLGQETAENLLETYEQDYLKSFISGVAETNPRKALQIAEDERVADAFTDNDQLFKFKSGLEARVKRFDKANKQKSQASGMRATNSLLNEVGNMGYAEMQQRFSEFNVSPAAQAFYEDVSGYANTKRRLSAEEKADGKTKFHAFMSQIVGKDDLTNDDIQLLQDAVYTGMKKQVLAKNEGYSLLNDLLDPVLEAQSNRADKFETGKWNPFEQNLGLDTLNQEITKITGADNFTLRKTGDNAGTIKSSEQQFILNKNANLMYDTYLQSLQEQAEVRNTTVSGLGSLPYKEEVEVYNKALDTAKRTFNKKTFGRDDVNGSVRPAQPKIDVGAVVLDKASGDRYKFTGGNPNDQKNWEKQ